MDMTTAFGEMGPSKFENFSLWFSLSIRTVKGSISTVLSGEKDKRKTFHRLNVRNRDRYQIKE